VPTSLRVMGTRYGHGAVAVWVEKVTSPDSASYDRIMAQKINDTGLPAWPEPVVIATGTADVAIGELALSDSSVNHGAGGALEEGVVIAWHQWPVGKTASGSEKWYRNDVFLQRIDAKGNLTWPAGGVPLNINRAVENAAPFGPMLVGEKDGGVIVLWEDLRHGLSSIYAQRLDKDGQALWTEGGAEVLYVNTSAGFFCRQAVTDTEDGAIISCATSQHVLTQRIDSHGQTTWGHGIIVAGVRTTNHQLMTAGNGAAIIAWASAGEQKSFIQQIGSLGNILWGESGTRLGADSITPTAAP